LPLVPNTASLPPNQMHSKTGYSGSTPQEKPDKGHPKGEGYVYMISHTLTCLNSPSLTRRWKCGEPYHYSIPEPEGNPWEVVWEALLKKDKIQCDGWKDEVQNLLIFVGFSFHLSLILLIMIPVEQGWAFLCGSNRFRR